MNLSIGIEIFEEGGKNLVTVSHEGSTGCTYEFELKDELKQIVADYVADLIDCGYED